jgi:hypothetical protein
MMLLAKKKVRLLILISMLFAIPISEGRIGYEIDVYVNNSTTGSHWGIGQSTSVLNWNYESKVSGDGNYSKYADIQGLAGMNRKENTFANNGHITAKDVQNVIGRFGWIDIDEVVTNKAERYTLDINESLPAGISDQNQIIYRGKGIYMRESYENNNNKIMTNYYATKFSKTIDYRSYYQNALIHADIIPGRICADVLRNYGMGFALSSISDKSLRFVYDSNGLVIDQSYVGNFNLNKKIQMGQKFIKDEQEDDNLNCCSSGSNQEVIGLNISCMLNATSNDLKNLNMTS